MDVKLVVIFFLIDLSCGVAELSCLQRGFATLAGLDPQVFKEPGESKSLMRSKLPLNSCYSKGCII